MAFGLGPEQPWRAVGPNRGCDEDERGRGARRISEQRRSSVHSPGRCLSLINSTNRMKSFTIKVREPACGHPSSLPKTGRYVEAN